MVKVLVPDVKASEFHGELIDPIVDVLGKLRCTRNNLMLGQDVDGLDSATKKAILNLRSFDKLHLDFYATDRDELILGVS